MHHESGSALQKVTFVLVLFVAAAAGYLVVRERLRAERQRATEAAAAVKQQEEISQAVTKYHSNMAATNPVTYAPLRARVVTNTVRVPSNRFIAVSNANVPGAPPVVLVGESQPYTRNQAQLAVAGSSPVFPGGGGRSGGASVTGRVLLRGTPPPEKVIVMDAACAALQPAPITTRHYVTGPGGTLADVFVYVKQGAEAQPVSRSASTPLLDQVNCEYVPYVIGVQVGQVLKVRNSDPVLHNIHPLSRAGNKERNVGQPGRGHVSDFVFEKPEVFVQFKCDVHPWMFAYVGVVEHPWFAVTDGNGAFALPSGLPPGQYTLAAVHRKLGEQTQTITVGANGSAPVAFTLEVPGP